METQKIGHPLCIGRRNPTLQGLFQSGNQIFPYARSKWYTFCFVQRPNQTFNPFLINLTKGVCYKISRIWESSLRGTLSAIASKRFSKTYKLKASGNEISSQRITSRYTKMIVNYVSCLKLLTLIAYNFLFSVFATLFDDCCLNLAVSTEIFPFQLP